MFKKLINLQSYLRDKFIEDDCQEEAAQIMQPKTSEDLAKTIIKLIDTGPEDSMAWLIEAIVESENMKWSTAFGERSIYHPRSED